MSIPAGKRFRRAPDGIDEADRTGDALITELRDDLGMSDEILAHLMQALAPGP